MNLSVSEIHAAVVRCRAEAAQAQADWEMSPMQIAEFLALQYEGTEQGAVYSAAYAHFCGTVWAGDYIEFPESFILRAPPPAMVPDGEDDVSF